MEKKARLKPCPFCGSRSVETFGLHDIFPATPFNVFCKKCRAMGPFYQTIEEAIEAWNRRTP